MYVWRGWGLDGAGSVLHCGTGDPKWYLLTGCLRPLAGIGAKGRAHPAVPKKKKAA